MPQIPTPRPVSRGAAPWIALLTAALGACPGPDAAMAQIARTEAASPAARPGPTGRTFAGVAFDLPESPGGVELAARRGWGWTEQETLANRPHVAQRVYLEGDVRLTLGPYSFTASRASLWLTRAGGDGAADEPGQAGGTLWQVFALLENANAGDEAGSIAVSGGRLPVRGLIRAAPGQEVQLRADRLEQGRPDAPFIAEAEAALAERLRPALAPPAAPRTPAPPAPTAPSALDPQDPLWRAQREAVAAAAQRLPPAQREEPIFSPQGIITFSRPDQASYLPPNMGGPAVVVGNGVTITYQHRAPGEERNLQISGERAVVFLAEAQADPALPAPAPPAPPQGGPLEASRVRGIYIEGDVVATDGVNTIRAPRVYYSVQDNRALLIDAVFWTYDERRQLPLYVRAKTIEQLSSTEFRATGARLSNTPFFEPDLSIGVSSVTISRRPGSGGPLALPAGDDPSAPPAEAPADRGSDVLIDARHITLRAGGIPFFYWPRLKGDPAAVPLRDIRLENSSGSGAALKTTWDFYSLVGLRTTPGNSADLIVDGYFERGLALGADLRWRTDRGRGGLFGYFLPADEGTDILPTGQRRSHDGDPRGMLLAEHRAALSEKWSLFAEGSYISDETFIFGFFDPLARNRREFTNSLYLRRLHENTMLFGELRARSTDFIANEALLQAPGYTVARYPDAGYLRFADDLLARHPGLLTYSSSYRFTQMRMEFSDPAVEELGYRAPARARDLFGILPSQSTADALRARGLTEEPVARFDTRHELSLQLAAGPVAITPFLAGRATVYDDTFESFATDADEYYRLWSSQGVTFSTELSKVNETIRSRLLDLHRIRHIVQPSITLWHAATTVDRADLPVFDDEVESLAEGPAARFAIDQTWQTQRGGPRRWRSVDVLRLSAAVVVSGGEVEKESPIGRYFDYRPELSNLGGTFATLEGAWQVSEILALGGETVYDFDVSQPARTALGYTLQHDRDFSTFGELRYINALDQTYALLGAHFDLTSKYSFTTTGSYDTVRSEFQSVSIDLRRRLPNVVLGVGVSYNNITSVTSFGFVFQPVGLARQGARFRAGGPAGGF